MSGLSEQEQYAKLEEAIAQYKGTKGPLMPIMQAAQNIFGYLPMKAMNTIAEELKIPITEVYGVATFYAQFTLEAKGEHTISVCLGTACYVKGSQEVLNKLVSELGIHEGSTTKDGKFSLEACRCVGACGLAPVMMIDNEVYGRLTPDMIPGILAKY